MGIRSVCVMGIRSECVMGIRSICVMGMGMKVYNYVGHKMLRLHNSYFLVHVCSTTYQ